MIAASRWLGLPILILSAMAVGLELAPRVMVRKVCAYLIAPMQKPLENRFARASIETGGPIAGLVVPGGGYERLREAIRLARLLPAARIVISGDIASEGQLDEAGMLGAGRIIVERNAGSTYENAVFSKSIAEPKAGERWLLVTSAIHMQRAYGTFQTAGFDVEPWPVYDGERQYSQFQNVALLVIHELMGLVIYRVMGRTDELLPSPKPRSKAGIPTTKAAECPFEPETPPGTGCGMRQPARW